MLDEGRLQRVQLSPSLAEPLDRGDLRAVVGDREREAAVGAPPVDQDRARAALAVVAALLGAGEAEVLAQEVEQRGAGVDREPVLGAVDPERDLGVHGRQATPRVLWLWPWPRSLARRQPAAR